MLLSPRRHLLGLLLWTLGQTAFAQIQPDVDAAAVLIVSSDATPVYQDAARLIALHLGKDGWSADKVRQTTAAELAQAMRLGAMPRPRLWVSLGVDAATTLANSRVQAPVLAVLIPRSSFQRVLQGSGRRVSSQFTALYLDQPLRRQLNLIRLALPSARRVGVLLGAESAERLGALKSFAASSGLSLVEATVDAQAGIFLPLKQVLGDADVLLALADPQVFNNNSIQNILLAAFRAKVPLVGFSPAYVRAGALLSLHVTPGQAARQAAALARQFLAGQSLPASPVESDDFEVGVNAHVARALGLDLDPQALQRSLLDAEGLP